MNKSKTQRTIKVSPEIHEAVRDYCKSRNLIITKWVEAALTKAVNDKQI